MFLDLLRDTAVTANQQGRGRRHIEALMLQALALQSLDRPDEALSVVTESLVSPNPKDPCRVFADEGTALRRSY